MSREEIQATITNAPIVAHPRMSSLDDDGDSLHGADAGEIGGEGGDDPPFGDDGGFGENDGLDGVVEDMNKAHSLVLMGSRAVIIREVPDGPIEDRARVLSIQAFKDYYSNQSCPVKRKALDENGRTTVVTRHIRKAVYWLGARDRRTYDGIEFYPDPKNKPGTSDYFNLWRGFAVVPDPASPGERMQKYTTFRDHLMTNICAEDRTYYEWLFAWFAHIVQRPRERIGTAIVLRGKMGSGKTKVGEIVGSLFPSHYFLVDDPRYLVGQFNAHMASCLLLQVDEGFWAGDKAAEGRLKGLVTSSKQMIEAKGVDPIRLDNYVRLMFSSNEDWVIPAGVDERRFCVFDVAPHVAQNHAYFAAIDREMASGGREAFLADLLAYDLDRPGAPNLRVIPKTAALLEQKLRSLDPITQWYFERLCDGALTRRAGVWHRTIEVDTLFDDYVHQAEKIGVRRKAEKTSFGMKMHKLVPDLERKKALVEIVSDDGRSVENRRRYVFKFPTLDICRAAFQDMVGQVIDWGPPDPGDAGPHAGAESAGNVDDF